jgi:hypothetical protein
LRCAATGLRAAHRLKVGVADESALAVATAGRGTAIGLAIGVTDEAALAARRSARVLTCGAGAAFGLAIGVTDEAALTAATPGFGPASGLKVGLFAEADDLEFSLAVGPLGVFVDNGHARISATADNTAEGTLTFSYERTSP